MALEYFIKEEFEKFPQVYSCEILPSYNKSWGYSTILTEEEIQELLPEENEEENNNVSQKQ